MDIGWCSTLQLLTRCVQIAVDVQHPPQAKQPDGVFQSACHSGALNNGSSRLQTPFLKRLKSVFSFFFHGQRGGRGRGGGNTLLRVRWGRLRRYLPIPELPLERRSGSVSRSAPCTGTVQPADRKARLASHKEANMEEHFLSQKGLRPENTLQPSFLTEGRWQTHTGWPTEGSVWWIGILFLRHTCTEKSQHASGCTKRKNTQWSSDLFQQREGRVIFLFYLIIFVFILLFHYPNGSVNWILESNKVDTGLKNTGSFPEKEMSMFGLAPDLRVLPSLGQWDVDVEVGLGQMRKMR